MHASQLKVPEKKSKERLFRETFLLAKWESGRDAKLGGWEHGPLRKACGEMHRC